MNAPTLTQVVSWAVAIGGGLALAIVAFFCVLDFFDVDWDVWWPSKDKR